MKSAAIVLAAGRGRRMQSVLPKQYLELDGKPVLYYSLKAFEESTVDEIILVTAKEEITYCQKEIVDKYHLHKIKKITAGGMERYHSVYHGLCSLENVDYVLIHDGARPFIKKEEIEKLLEMTKTYPACIAGVPVKDTIKLVDNDNCVIDTPNRKQLWQVQTPQVFQYSLVRTAYDKLMEQEVTDVTDDAMVVERFGDSRVKLVEMSWNNIKITTPEDIIFAKALIRQGKKRSV